MTNIDLNQPGFSPFLLGGIFFVALAAVLGGEDFLSPVNMVAGLVSTFFVPLDTLDITPDDWPALVVDLLDLLVGFFFAVDLVAGSELENGHQAASALDAGKHRAKAVAKSKLVVMGDRLIRELLVRCTTAPPDMNRALGFCLPTVAISRLGSQRLIFRVRSVSKRS